MLPKIEFKIDADNELAYLKKFAEMCGTSKLKPESLELLKKSSKEAIKIIEIGYQQKDFIEFVKNLKKEWERIGEAYLKKIEELTGFKWQHDQYICYISLNVPGLSDLFDKKLDKIILSNILPASTMKYVLAHELFHLHYFYICKKEKMSIEAASTTINEALPLLLMVVNKDLGKLWPDISLERVRNSYPGVNKIIDELVKIYKPNMNFIELINKSIEIKKKIKIT